VYCSPIWELDAPYIVIVFILIPLNPLKGTLILEKTENNYGLLPFKSPLEDLGIKLQLFPVTKVKTFFGFSFQNSYFCTSYIFAINYKQNKYYGKYS
jgi:hypothetical protein